MKKLAQQTFLRLSYIIVLFSLFRLTFFIIFFDRFSDAKAGELARVFRDGIRFDLSAMSWTFGLALIFSHLPSNRLQKSAWFQRLTTLVFWSSLLPPILLESIDLELFRHTGRRITVEIFTANQGVGDQFPSLLINYWPIGILMLGLGFVSWKFARWTELEICDEQNFFPSRPAALLCWLIIPIFTFCTYVGPLKPGGLTLAHAYQYSIPAMGNLALDSTFHFIKSVEAQLLNVPSGFASVKLENPSTYSFWTQSPPRASKAQEAQPPENVVLFILESFSTEYTGLEVVGRDPRPSYTPHLDAIAAQGVSFPNHYANARRSIHSLPGILASIPDWLGTPYITSSYRNHPLFGLGHLGRKKGYKTYFFHGAKNGSMQFDSFSRAAGFENYFGLKEYQGDRESIEATWGVYDAPFLQFSLKRINESKGPFISVIYTITSHEPFRLPEGASALKNRGTQKIHPTILYTDDAIHQFMKEASKYPWFEKTLFVFTADHTHTLESRQFNHLLGRYDVPLIFYHPKRSLKFPNRNRVTHHLDILPTVADYLNITIPSALPFGTSLFTEDNPYTNRALLMESGAFYLVRPASTLVLQVEPDGKGRFGAIETNTSRPVSVGNDANYIDRQNELLSLVHYFQNGLSQKTWYSGRH
jgi:phosphoglycerol transferase MdoB-like AlkP superfamily enzyme